MEFTVYVAVVSFTLTMGISGCITMFGLGVMVGALTTK
jgi:hypothetical protein